MSKEEEKKETKVYVDGKLVPFKELEKAYPQISLAGTAGNVKILNTLIATEKPLDRREIAKRTGLSEGYCRDILKKLMKKEYVLEFRIGGRTLYYLLTERGLKLSKEIADKQ